MKELRQEGKIGQIPDYSPTMKPEFPDFTKWLERPGRTPREITHRLRIRAILGMSVSR